jgi:hypothetical protein
MDSLRAEGTGGIQKLRWPRVISEYREPDGCSSRRRPWAAVSPPFASDVRSGHRPGSQRRRIKSSSRICSRGRQRQHEHARSPCGRSRRRRRSLMHGDLRRCTSSEWRVMQSSRKSALRCRKGRDPRPRQECPQRVPRHLDGMARGLSCWEDRFRTLELRDSLCGVPG